MIHGIKDAKKKGSQRAKKVANEQKKVKNNSAGKQKKKT